ncbi:MAG: DUF4230 domain-containing protein [Cyclobacteriaceae bacterium]|nr:DUF4230 domain-containing protein [Cyclobacteriaceae bacterium]
MILFWKQIGLVLQILLVVAAVLAFSFFDPFGMLKSKKQKLENTPIVVKSIRDIGQLITSEYYGEVLNSLQQSRINQVMDDMVVHEEEYKSLHNQYQKAVAEMIADKTDYRVSRWNKKNDLYEYFYFRFASLTENPYYQDYIEWLLTKMKPKTEKQLLKYFYTESDMALAELNKLQMTSELSIAIRQITDARLNELSADRKFRKQQIVVLGRGWVKAGIDFGKFTQHNFKYDENTKTIHLIGMKPEILACTINPWFIPEKQVKGFEVILVSRKANEPMFMQMVKEETLKKLRNNAIEAGLLEKARENAMANLKDFFSLLIPDGVEHVILHDDFFSYFDTSMQLDSISPPVMKTIDSLLVRRFATDSTEVIAMRDSLRQHKRILVGDSTYRVQRFSSLLAFIEDEELSSGEMAQLQALGAQLNEAYLAVGSDTSTQAKTPPGLHPLDTIWYYPDQKMRQALQNMANQATAPEKPFGTWQIISQSTPYKQWRQKRNNYYRNLIAKSILKQKRDDFETILSQIKSHAAQVVIANETFIAGGAKETYSSTVTIEGQTIRQTSDIQQTINSALNKNLLPLSGEALSQVLDSLHQTFNRQKPQDFVPIRELAHIRYRYCMEGACAPIGKYSRILDSIDLDTTQTAVLAMLEHEIKQTKSGLDTLAGQHIDLPDSMWYFPSQSVLAKLASDADEAFPRDAFTDFFGKTFKSKKYKQWQKDRNAHFHQLIYSEMLNRRLLELEETTRMVTKSN